jgi:Tfp pilus assembly ATPase PilU
MCGINLRIYWDFRKNHKTEFEKVCLLAFLAIKSILGQKAFCKITNDFFVARMDGKAKTCKSLEISPALQKYINEYQLNRIKMTLKSKWYLVTYGRRMRGFYVAFDMSLDELIYNAEKARDKNIKLKLKREEDAALARALERIKSER